MDKEKWHPGKLLETSGYYWKTCTLHAGVKLDLFTIIGTAQPSAATVAEKLEASLDGTTRLLDALVAMGLLSKSADSYANTEASAAYLVKDSPKYLGHMIMHHHHLVEQWSRLDVSVSRGKPVRTRKLFDDPVHREAFLMGMFNNAMLMAPGLVKEVDLSGRKHLLDLGGGPGTYAIHFCLANPGLNATVYDLPTTRPFAEKTIDRFEMKARINFQEGNYVDQGISGRYDVIWMSHILHGEGPDVCRQIIEKAVKVLEPGGLIVIHDFVLDDTMDGPLFPALFSLNMLLGTDAGRSYSQAQLEEMLRTNGIGNIQRLPFIGPTESGLLAGTR